MLNRTGRSSVKNRTPYELWYERKLVVDHFRIFGTEVYVHIPKEKRKKWNAKSKKGVFVGYCDDTKGYRIWLPDEKKIMIGRDVIFNEEPLAQNTQPSLLKSIDNVSVVTVENEYISSGEMESDDDADDDTNDSTVDLTNDTSTDSFSNKEFR